MEESILDTIVRMLGDDPAYQQFTTDVLVHINGALMNLEQIGVGPSGGFTVTSNQETWRDFLGPSNLFEAAKNYVYITVKLAFDLPSNSFVAQSLQKQADEWFWRLGVNAERTIL